MSIEKYWEKPLRSLERLGEYLLQFEFLDHFSFRTRSFLASAFGVVHLVAAGLFLLGLKSVANPIFVVLGLLWAVYLSIFVFFYLLVGSISGLYNYLRSKDLPPSHSILFSILVVVGAIAVLYMLSFAYGAAGP